MMKFIMNNYLKVFIAILIFSLIFITTNTVNAGIGDEDGMTELMRALWENEDIEVIKEMIDKGADVNTHNEENSMNAIMYAAAGHQNPEVIKLLLEKQENLLDSVSSQFFNSLMYALKYNPNPDVIEVILDKMGEDIGNKQMRLMHAVARNEDLNIIKELVEKGANVSSRTKRGLSVLMCAVIGNENPDVIQYLINEGASVNARTEFGISPLMYAAAGNNNPDIIEVLLDAGANLNSSDRMGLNALDYALSNMQNTKKDIIERLLKQDIKINKKKSEYLNEATTIHFAVKQNIEPKIFKLLIDAGANVNTKDKYGASPLRHAAMWGVNSELVKILIEADADVNEKLKDERTILHSAVSRDINPEIVKLLIDAGAKVNAETEDGATPLLKALSKKEPSKNIENLRKAIKILIKASADVNKGLNLVVQSGPNGVDFIVRPPLIWAVGNTQDPEIVRMLIDAGANINKTGVVRDTPGRTALHQAVYDENYKLVKILIGAGIDVNIRGDDGKTSLIMAAEYNTSTEIIEYLLDAGADGSLKYDGKTAFDYYEENENLKNNTDLYWKLNDSQY